MKDRDCDDYFGTCPVCRRHDGYVNINRQHFFLCRQHRVFWCVGGGLFNGWRDEDPAVWEKNARQLSHYTQIKEWRPTEPLRPVELVQPVETLPNNDDSELDALWVLDIDDSELDTLWALEQPEQPEQRQEPSDDGPGHLIGTPIELYGGRVI